MTPPTTPFVKLLILIMVMSVRGLDEVHNHIITSFYNMSMMKENDDINNGMNKRNLVDYVGGLTQWSNYTQSFPNVWTSRCCHASVRAGNDIYVIGGAIATGENIFDIYSISNKVIYILFIYITIRRCKWNLQIC